MYLYSLTVAGEINLMQIEPLNTKSMRHVNVTSISWEHICDVWSNFLWKGRPDIMPISCMLFTDGVDPGIKQQFIPRHYGLFVDSKLAGVISGHNSSIKEYRCRGIFVYPEYRKKNYSALLFSKVQDDAIKNQCDILWSYPRLTALPSYSRFGFNIAGDIENTGFSGPNIRVYKALRKDK